MRILIGCLLFTAASSVIAPTSEELHNRYGETDMERFAARPGISVTVQYGSDHEACEMRIEPPKSLIHADEQSPLMSSNDVSEVLEEVVPEATRGVKMNEGSFQSGCNVADIAQYENVDISRILHTCDPSSPNHDANTIIIFKREICPAPKNIFGGTRP